MMVYKHAISTISPMQPLKNSFQDNKDTKRPVSTEETNM